MKKHLLMALMTSLLMVTLIACGKDEDKDLKETNKGVTGQPEASVTPELSATPELTPTVAEGEPATVYFTKDISPEGLVRIYEALGRKAEGNVAIKIHMGEPTGTNYLKPDLVKDFVLSVDGTFVDCNTAYGGRRASTAAHLQVAEDHGFTAYTDVDIMDAEGSVALPIENGKHLEEDMVGKNYENYDFFVILSHFKGHEMGGFGGAIKNMSIGIASFEGKCLIHTAGQYHNNAFMGTPQLDFLESMAEAAKAVADDCGENIIYISVMNNMSIDCDCNGFPAAPKMEDIGILASLDPVALDRACVDLVYAAPEEQNDTLVARIEAKKGTHTLDYAEEIGLGTQNYELVNIDE